MFSKGNKVHDDLESDVNKLKQDLTNSKSKIDEQAAAYADAEKKMLRKLEDLLQDQISFRLEIKQYKKQVAELGSEAEAEKKLIEQSKVEYALLYESLKEQHGAACVSKMEALVREITALKDAAPVPTQAPVTAQHSSSFEVASLRRQLEECRRDRDNFAADYRAASGNFESSESNFEECEKRLKESEKALKRMESERTTASLQLRACQQELFRVNQELSNIQQKELWDSLDGSGDNGNPKFDDLKRNLEYSEEKVAELKLEMSKMKNDFSFEKLQLEKQLVEYKRERDNLVGDFENVSASLEVAETELEDSQRKLKLLAQIQSERETLSLQLRILQNDLLTANQELSLYKQRDLWKAMDGEEEDNKLKEVVEALEEALETQKENEQRIQEINSQAAEVQVVLEETKLRVTDAELERDAVKREVNELNTNYMNELVKLRQSKLETEQQLSSIVKEVENCNRDLRNMNGDMGNISSALEEAEEALQENEKKAKEMKRQMDAEISGLALQLRVARNEALRANEDLKTVRELNFIEAIRVQNTDQQLADIIRGLQQVLDLSKENLSKVQRELTMTKQELQMSSIKYAQLSKDLAECSRDRDSLASDCRSAVESFETADAALEESDKKLKSLEKSHKQIQGERDSLSLQLRATQNELLGVSQELSSIRNKELWMSMEGRDEERKYSVIVASLEGELDDCRNKLKRSAAENASLMFSNAQLGKQLEDNRREQDRLQTELRTFSVNLDDAEEQLEQTEKKWKNSEKTLKQVSNDRDSMSILLRANQNELLQLSVELSSFKNRELWKSIEAEDEDKKLSSVISHLETELDITLKEKMALKESAEKSLAEATAQADEKLTQAQQSFRTQLEKIQVRFLDIQKVAIEKQNQLQQQLLAVTEEFGEGLNLPVVAVAEESKDAPSDPHINPISIVPDNSIQETHIDP